MIEDIEKSKDSLDDMDSLDMDEEAKKYIDIVDAELPENVFDDDHEEDEDYDNWLKEQQKREWSIIYSKKPELIIDTDEYDKILVNLLMSYQEFKQSINDMDKLKEIRNE